MSQTRQPIHVFPKVTLRLGFWGRATIILVILTLIASYLLYHHGIRYKNREVAHYKETQSQLQHIQEQTLQLHTKNSLLQQQVDQLQLQLSQLKAATQPTQKQTWLLKQVAHYVALAEQHLWLQQDSQSAILLLSIADQLLQEYGTSQTLALRQAIAQDVLTLSQQQQIDYAGISLKLDALKQQANTTLQAQVNPPTTAPNTSVPEESAWQKGLTVLKSLVSIQHHDSQGTPLLTQETRWLMQQNVYLALHQAQLALWQHQQARYQQSLQEAAHLLSPYQGVQTQYAAWLQQIQTLSAVNLNANNRQLSDTPKVLAQLQMAEQKTELPSPSQSLTP